MCNCVPVSYSVYSYKCIKTLHICIYISTKVIGNKTLKSKLGFYVPFNSQGHIDSSLQHCQLWEVNPQRGHCLRLHAEYGNH